MTFAADNSYICEEEREAADWHYKLRAAGRKHLLMKKLSGHSGGPLQKNNVFSITPRSVLIDFEISFFYSLAFHRIHLSTETSLRCSPACAWPTDPAVQSTGGLHVLCFRFFWQVRCHLKQFSVTKSQRGTTTPCVLIDAAVTMASRSQSHQNGLEIIKMITRKIKSRAPQISDSFESGIPGPLSHP